MCGIVGVINLNKESVNLETIKSMTNSLRHRGPDFKNYYVDGYIGLGHTRLSIIDLSTAGNQPMATDDKKMWIVYNGEVYNFKEIRELLIEKGFNFKSDSDTEVVLKSYQYWGQECLEKFNGMYAFAIWDDRKKTMFIARDRMGIKPLYYYHSANIFAFSSEIKALLLHDEIKKEINFASFNSYLTFRYVPGMATIFKNIYKVQPAHYMVVKEGNVENRKYWDFEFQFDDSLSEQQWLEEFYTLLNDSVRKRLISDVPVGVFLSGGVDSTAITGLLGRIGHDPIKTFSVGFDSSIDERITALQVSKYFKTEHNEFVVKEQDFSKLREILWYLDEPFGDIIILPMFLLSRFASQSVRVVLSGDGADELFGGYVHQQNLYRMSKVKDFLPQTVLRLASSIVSLFPVKYLDLLFQYPASMGEKGKERLMQLILNAKQPVESYLSFVSLFSEEEKTRLLSPELREQVKSSYESEWQNRLATNLNRKNCNYFNRLIRQEIGTWLPDNILFKLDRLTMGNSIEGRVPFLDHRIVEFCARLPIKFKTHGENKHILREVVRKRIYKPMGNVKKAFFMPLTGLFEKPFQLLINEYLSEECVRLNGWWNYDFVKEIIQKRKKSALLYDKQIMALILWQMWADVFGVKTHL